MQIIPPEFEKILLELLKEGNKFKEHELMQELVKSGFEQFSPSLDALKLFQTHFLLFHFLYRLQQKWLNEKSGFLEIHTLEIKLNSFQKTSEQTLPAGKDSLREYYLNLDNLTETTQDDVNQLLDNFWNTFEQWLSPENIVEDLNTMELSIDDFNHHNLQQQRRTLLQKYHPDKGGCSERFNNIQQASKRLENHLSHQK